LRRQTTRRYGMDAPACEVQVRQGKWPLRIIHIGGNLDRIRFEPGRTTGYKCSEQGPHVCPGPQPTTLCGICLRMQANIIPSIAICCVFASPLLVVVKPRINQAGRISRSSRWDLTLVAANKSVATLRHFHDIR